jgi:hypothetical protein
MIMGLASALSTLVGLAMQVALLAVVLTTVRRHKPRAVPLLAASFGVSIASTILSAAAYPMAGLVASRTGVQNYAVVQASLSVGFALVHIVSGVLLLLGLVKLATPDADPPV